MFTKTSARQPEPLGELPRPPGADLDAHHPAHHEQRALDDPEGAAHLPLEARVAGDVEEVELAPLPLGVDERERDRELALVLVVVPVRDGRARFDRAQPVDLTGLEEQRLDERRLARAAMADDSDVAELPRFEGRHGLVVLLGS